MIMRRVAFQFRSIQLVRGLVSSLVLTLAGFTLSASAQDVRLTATAGAEDDRFGWDVAMDGDLIVIGAEGVDDHLADKSNSGAAYLFRFLANEWVLEKTLTPSNPQGNGHFGYAVAASGDTVLVGEPGASFFGEQNSNLRGVVHVFVRQGTDWQEESVLTASDGVGGARFGWSVDIKNGTIVVGAPRDNSHGDGADDGAVYVFEKVDGGWIEKSKLFDAEGIFSAEFGWSVRTSGERLIVGAPFEIGELIGIRAGAAYIYSRVDGVWTLEEKMNAPVPIDNGEFGWSVAVNGERAFAGEIFDDTKGYRAGSVHAYVVGESGWIHESEITASNAEIEDYFGYSIALSGDRLLIGALLHNEDPATRGGTVYVFDWDGLDWIEGNRLTALQGDEAFGFGRAVALSDNRAVVGAANSNISDVKTGASYTFGPTSLSISDAAELGLGGSLNLSPGYPSPFNSSATLILTTGQTEFVSVDLFDVVGRLRATLYGGLLLTGDRKEIVVSGHLLADGLYFVRARGVRSTVSREILLIK